MVEDKTKLVEKITADLKAGLRPKEIADKYNQKANRIGSLAKLLGYDFSPVKRDPKDWYPVPSFRQHIGFSAKLLNIDVKRYRVINVNPKLKNIVIEYE